MDNLMDQLQDIEAIGDTNHLPAIPPALQPGNNPTQVQLEDEEWVTTYRPSARRIVQSGIALLLFIFRDVCFEKELKVHWAYLPLILMQLVIAASVLHSIVALSFSANMTSKERCQQVRFSFVWIIIGIALVVLTPIIRMATSYLTSPA